MRESMLSLLLLSLLVGCGGDDGGTGPEEDPPNRRPQVFISSATNNRVEVAGASVTLTAVGSDNDGEEDSVAPGRTTLVTATEIAAGTQMGNRTFGAADSPYVIMGDYTVGPAATLTIGHGTAIYLRASLGPGTNVDRLVFRVEGVLNAGTTAGGAPITFQGSRVPSSMPDDKRQWDGLEFANAGGGTLYRVSLRDAERGILNGGTTTLTVRNSSVQGAAVGMALVDPDGTGPGEGIVSTTILEDCSISSSAAHGIRVESSVLTMTGCSISGSGGYGLWASATSDFASVSVSTTSFGQSGSANLKYENNLKPFSFVVNDCNLVPGGGGINFEFGSCPFGGAFDITQNYWGVNAETDVSGILADFTGHQSCPSPDFDSWIADVDWYNTPVVFP